MTTTDDDGRFAWMERAACRDLALDNERFGYWGGQSAHQRAATLRARRINQAR